jgi:glutamyl-tRNA synthetase
MVITRLAPSPTGKFHIGTARTALFNYLFAKKNEGKFLLRIEDTDQARSSEEHIDDIKESLHWLGLPWDNRNSEHYQSQHLDRYQEIAKELVGNGAAYEKEGAVYFKVKSQKLKVKSASQKSKVSDGEKDLKSYFLNPKSIIFNDLVCGEVATQLENIEDFVILKSDGWPTFHLAVVVDDHDMDVTHVIRGADHLSNTPKHILLYDALGWEKPRWGHLPLILNSNRTKMSKRHDPVSVTDDFKNQGFLPEAMVNFLALLGWNPKTEEEFFTLQALTKRFDIAGVQKGNAVFDSGRLRFFNAHYLRQKSLGEIVALAKPLWAEDYDTERFSAEYLESVAALIVSRAEVVADLGEGIDYFFTEPRLERDDLVFKKSTVEATASGLKKTIKELASLAVDDWRRQAKISRVLVRVVANNNLTNGDVFWPVRYALSGAKASPKPEELLVVLGKEVSLKRLQLAADLLRQ